MARRCYLLLALGLTLGCGDGKLQLYPVSGQVLVNGRPAAGVTVCLHPADGRDFDERGARPTGTTGEDGRFTLSTYATGDGAPAGEYQVSLFWPDASGPGQGSAPDRFKGKHLDPKASPWVVQIEKGPTELAPINVPTEDKKGSR